MSNTVAVVSFVDLIFHHALAQPEKPAIILPDRVVNLADGEGFPEADPDAMELTDLDTDDVEALADRDASDEDR